jgi:Tfp pilus assembly protein PilO
MNTSTKKLIVSLGGLLLVVGSLGIFIGSIMPQISTIKELQGKRQATADLLENYGEAIQETNRIISKYQSVDNLDTVFSEVIPEKPDVPSFLNQVYGLAKLNDVFIDLIDFQEMPLQVAEEGSLIQPYGSVRASIRCVSDYEEMKSYLNAIETNTRLMNVKLINIDGGFTSEPKLSYTITVEAYYLPE